MNGVSNLASMQPLTKDCPSLEISSFAQDSIPPSKRITLHSLTPQLKVGILEPHIKCTVLSRRITPINFNIELSVWVNSSLETKI